ncbi:uncharacterized protein CMC5_011420 [Chondromyces crocatus]|uniref:Uncharacterized protein n=1 Tax=Chondromyces crocatus TaxID=52 RepID=A0A0K1E807_CHOCO|nr:uncharacterized protein CMC5_011420 [Chondromyces crocatus]
MRCSMPTASKRSSSRARPRTRPHVLLPARRLPAFHPSPRSPASALLPSLRLSLCKRPSRKRLLRKRPSSRRPKACAMRPSPQEIPFLTRSSAPCAWARKRCPSSLRALQPSRSPRPHRRDLARALSFPCRGLPRPSRRLEGPAPRKTLSRIRSSVPCVWKRKRCPSSLRALQPSRSLRSHRQDPPRALSFRCRSPQRTTMILSLARSSVLVSRPSTSCRFLRLARVRRALPWAGPARVILPQRRTRRSRSARCNRLRPRHPVSSRKTRSTRPPWERSLPQETLFPFRPPPPGQRLRKRLHGLRLPMLDLPRHLLVARSQRLSQRPRRQRRRLHHHRGPRGQTSTSTSTPPSAPSSPSFLARSRPPSSATVCTNRRAGLPSIPHGKRGSRPMRARTPRGKSTTGASTPTGPRRSAREVVEAS